MSHNGRVAGRDLFPAELHSPQLKRLRNVQRLGTERSGHASVEHVRHQLYVGQDVETNGRALLKVTTRPGIVYEQNLVNEAGVLSTINRELPTSRHFPLLLDHGRVRDGRMFVLMSFFDEWPLATTIGAERRPDRLVGHLRTSHAVGAALAGLHRIGIVHVDLNPMNVLYRSDRGIPVIRIVDFESAYRGRTPWKRSVLQPADDVGVLGARGIRPRARPPRRRVLLGSCPVHDDRGVSVDLGRGGVIENCR